LIGLASINISKGEPMSKTALVIMARYPEPGKTKTRLGRTIGNDRAVSLYQAFLTDLAQRFACQTYDMHWAYTPPEANFPAYIAALAPPYAQHMACFPQQGAGLGARLHHVFIEMHKRGFERTIVIGSDSPHISLATVANACKALDNADVVLGPAEDGGYYLIAMRQPHNVFTGIPMSTSVVRQMTIELAHRQGLFVRLLQPLLDIDELSDLLCLAELLQEDHILAPATAACLSLVHPLGAR
jgi:uncharacterized protein